MTGQRTGRQILDDIEPFLQVLGGFALFHASVQLITLGLSCLRVPLVSPIAELVLAVSIVAGYWFWRTRRKATSVASAPPQRLSRLAIVIVFAALFVYLLLAVRSCFTGEASCDGNLYHLPAIHLWAKQGYVSWLDDRLPGATLINGYPKASELLSMVLVKALHADIPALANFLFVPLGSLGIMVLSRMLGATPSLAVAAGAAWALVPVNVVQSPTLYVDANYCSSAIAFIALLVSVVAQIRHLDNKTTLMWSAIAAGAAAGLAIGVKSSGLGLAGIGAITVAAVCLTPAIKTRQWSSLKRYVAPFVVASCLCLAVGGIWYIRNWVRCGSPFYPIGLTVAGYQIFPGSALDVILCTEPNTPAELRAVTPLARVTCVWLQCCGWEESFFAYDSRIGGLGYIWPLGCVPAAVALLISLRVRKSCPRRALFLLLLVVTFVTFLIQPMNWWARYTAWVHAFGLPALAAVLSALPRWKPDDGTKPTRLPRFIHAGRRGLLVGGGRIWGVSCLAMLITEGLLCCYVTVIGTVPWDTARKRMGRIHQLYCIPTNALLWPKLRYTVFDTIFSSNETVAVGPLLGHHDTNDGLLLGGLCSPADGRPIIVVGEHLDYQELHSLLAKNVRYLIWDEQLPLPPALQDSKFHQTHPPGHFVFELPRL